MEIRMKKVLLFLLLFASVIANAQQDTAKAPTFGWKHGLVAGLTITQASFTNWTAGGQNSLSYVSSLDGKSANDQETTNWTNTYKFAFGQARISGTGLRKTDDRIDLESILTYKVGTYINPYASASLKTQFAKGFVYDAAGNETAVSQFFDPAYLTQSAGVGYQPIPEIKTRLGAALREVITSNFPVYADDPETMEIENTLVQFGMESVTDAEWKIEESVLLTSRLELFSPFEQFDRVIIRNDNTIAAKISEYITAKFNLLLINDWRATPRTQVKETVACGISYTLF
jgi:hypothetical protein